ncbi:P-loop containing nucleoside triphosphate hydrolase protein, partial [Cercophora samala]
MMEVSPIYSFSSVAEFARIHKAGTENEFLQDARLIDEINAQGFKFDAWLITRIRQTTKRSEYLLLVQPGSHGEGKMPSQGAGGKVRVAFADGTFSAYWDVARIENPVALLGSSSSPLGKLPAYKVTVPTAQYHEVLDKPIFASTGSSPSSTAASPTHLSPEASSSPTKNSLDSSAVNRPGPDRDFHDHKSTLYPAPGLSLELNPIDVIKVNFHLFASESTKDSEIGALESLYGRHQNATDRQLDAFSYFVTLKNPAFVVNVYEQLPHMKKALDRPGWHNTSLGKRFQMLNAQQKEAYLHGFEHLPCGICILPGGPGAGKTHFNLFTIAMAQSEPMARLGKRQNDSAKVLFIVDMNSPVDDVANRMVRLYQDLGMKKSIIRMKGWGSEVRRSDKLNQAEDAAAGEIVNVDFTNQFLATVKEMTTGNPPTATCKAPSLDEAAWKRYEEYQDTQYESIKKYMDEELFGKEESLVVPLRFRNLVYSLYRDTLADADFIATTPVAAANHFKGMFKPDLVFFDESPHARELCNLIAIANFNPIVWIFCGDHRQTVPYVGSAGSGSENPYARQMQVSMMERAARAGVIRHELLINHRAYGNLHRLASGLWYDGRMVSGTAQTTNRPLVHVRNYLSRTIGSKPCGVPRLVVHLKGSVGEKVEGTSCWNPSHTAWVMARVKELLADQHFRKPDRMEPGTILIISPYKSAFHHYKKELKKLPQWAQKRVEARTVDVSQGHEAEFVFLDLSKDRSTDFLDDPNRLCVALTRARLGEVVMMSGNMIYSDHFNNRSKHLRRMYAACIDRSTPATSENGNENGLLAGNGHVVWLYAENAESEGWSTPLSEDRPTMAYDDLDEIDQSALLHRTATEALAAQQKRNEAFYRRSTTRKINQEAYNWLMGMEADDVQEKNSVQGEECVQEEDGVQGKEGVEENNVVQGQGIDQKQECIVEKETEGDERSSDRKGCVGVKDHGQEKNCVKEMECTEKEGPAVEVEMGSETSIEGLALLACYIGRLGSSLAD